MADTDRMWKIAKHSGGMNTLGVLSKTSQDTREMESPR